MKIDKDILTSIFDLYDDEELSIVDISPRAIYLISSYGRLFTLNGKQIKPNYNRKRGYYYLRTSAGGKQVHRLVAEAFIPKVSGKDYVNHKDGIKSNTQIS